MSKRDFASESIGGEKLKLRVRPCTLKKANDFVQVFHRHSARTARDGGKFAIAAVAGVDVVGVAIVGNPLSASLMDGLTSEVLRVCISPNAPRNCNSLLYGACRRIWFEMGGRLIITYTLTVESGMSLRGAGWVLAAVVRGHNPRTWGKADHLRRREQQIFEEGKCRWESVNNSVDAEDELIKWPASVRDIREGSLFYEST